MCSAWLSLNRLSMPAVGVRLLLRRRPALMETHARFEDQIARLLCG